LAFIEGQQSAHNQHGCKDGLSIEGIRNSLTGQLSGGWPRLPASTSTSAFIITSNLKGVLFPAALSGKKFVGAIGTANLPISLISLPAS